MEHLLEHLILHMRPPSLSSRFSEPLLEVAHETDTDTESGRENSADNEDAPPLPPHLAYTMSQVKRVDSEVADNLLVFGRAYASTFSFWKYIILAGVLGLIMGFLALAFFWSFYAVLCNWIFTPQYDRSVVTTTFHPTVMWVVIPTCTGFALGLVKLLPLGRFSFPIKIHGFFRKISSLEVILVVGDKAAFCDLSLEQLGSQSFDFRCISPSS